MCVSVQRRCIWTCVWSGSSVSYQVTGHSSSVIKVFRTRSWLWIPPVKTLATDCCCCWGHQLVGAFLNNLSLAIVALRAMKTSWKLLVPKADLMICLRWFAWFFFSPSVLKARSIKSLSCWRSKMSLSSLIVPPTLKASGSEERTLDTEDTEDQFDVCLNIICNLGMGMGQTFTVAAMMLAIGLPTTTELSGTSRIMGDFDCRTAPVLHSNHGLVSQ